MESNQPTPPPFQGGSEVIDAQATNTGFAEEAITEQDKSDAKMAHLLTMLIGLIGALIAYQKKDNSAFVKHHTTEALNFIISFAIWGVALCITFIGMIALPVWWILLIVFPIIAYGKASKGEYYNYPMTIRFIKHK